MGSHRKQSGALAKSDRTHAKMLRRRLLAVAILGSVFGQLFASSMLSVDCKQADRLGCRACREMPYCTFVVTHAGAMQEGSACIHWKDDERLKQLLGHLMMPGNSAHGVEPGTFTLRRPSATDTIPRELVLEMDGDYDAVLKLRTALADEFWAGGGSCPASWPPHAVWDTDSNIWEPVHGPGEQGTVGERSQRSSASPTTSSARFAQQAPLTDDSVAAIAEHERVREIRLNSDNVPLAFRGGQHPVSVPHRRLRLGSQDLQ